MTETSQLIVFPQSTEHTLESSELNYHRIMSPDDLGPPPSAIRIFSLLLAHNENWKISLQVTHVSLRATLRAYAEWVDPIYLTDSLNQERKEKQLDRRQQRLADRRKLQEAASEMTHRKRTGRRDSPIDQQSQDIDFETSMSRNHNHEPIKFDEERDLNFRRSTRTGRPQTFPVIMTNSQHRAQQPDVTFPTRKMQKDKGTKGAKRRIESIAEVEAEAQKKVTLLGRRIHHDEDGEEVEQLMTMDETWKDIDELEPEIKANLKQETCALEARAFIDAESNNDHLLRIDKISRKDEFLPASEIWKFEKFDPSFKNAALKFEGPISRLLYRIQSGPEPDLLRRNFQAIQSLPQETIPLLRNLVRVVQQEGLNYRSCVPDMHTAIKNWVTVRKAGQSLACYERLAQAIAGLELMAEFKYLKDQGWSVSQAKEIARRCVFPHWDEFDAESEESLDRQRSNSLREFYKMIKLAHILCGFGPAIFFDTSIYWAVLERTNEKLFQAINRWFQMPENIHQRNAWLNFSLEDTSDVSSSTAQEVNLNLFTQSRSNFLTGGLTHPNNMIEFSDESIKRCTQLWNINSAIVVVTDERSEVTGRDIRTLAPRGWLTDEIVNNYFGLIMQRYDDCFAFNTFFYTKLREGSSQDVMKHDKKVDIFAKRIIFIPVYLRAHWCLIIVNNENRTIEYFDSLHSRREVFDVIIKDYLTIKWRRKKKGKLPLYTSMHTQGPLQTNGWDCGIFACQTAEFTARRSDLYFEQKHMNYLRHKMTLEIADKTLMTTQ